MLRYRSRQSRYVEPRCNQNESIVPIIRDIGSFSGQREMTEFALRALGWVVARDACCEIVRSLAHRTPRIPLAVVRVLTKGGRR
jgi:hypothetical protein